MARLMAEGKVSQIGGVGRRLKQGALTLSHAFVSSFRTIGQGLHRTPLLTLIVAGFALRLVLAPITSWTHDVYFFYRVAVDTLGGLDPYATSFYTYPPLFAYLLFPPNLLLGLLANPAGFVELVPSIALAAETTEMIIPTVTSPLFNLVLKLPLIAADVGIALLLFGWVSHAYGEGRGKTAFLLWFLNPLVIWVTVLQGQFDVLPAFFTLAAAFLLTRRRFFFSGFALGVAVLFKFYPLFLVIPLLFLAAALGRGPSARRGPSWWPPAKAGLTFVLGIGIVLAILALPLLSTQFLEVTVVRRAQFPIFGGFQPLFIFHLDVWEGFELGQAILEALPGLRYDLLLAIPIVLSLLGGLLVLRGRRETVGEDQAHAAIAFLTVVPLVALFSALSLVNPQHLLWILPFLILASAVWRRLYVTIAVVSAGGLGFLLGLQGLAVFFYPLAVSTPLLAVEGIFGQVVAYWNLPGLVSTHLRRDILALAAGAGYVFLVYAAYRVTRGFLASPARARAPVPAPSNPGSWPRMERSVRVAVVGLAAFLVASQVLVLVPNIPNAAVVERVFPDALLSTVEVDLRGHTLFPASYRVTALALDEAPRDLPIYLYYDETYPISNTSAPRILGLSDHLRSELGNAGMPSDIRLVDAVSLPALLRGPPVILIMASTAWPATVFPAHPTLVNEWLVAGGILIWSGALLGAYAGTADGQVIDLRRGDPTRPWGPAVILGFDPVQAGGPSRSSTLSAWGTALATRFPLATWGARMSAIETYGGLALGGLTAESDPKATLSLFPVGNGTLALFGDAIGPVFTYSAEDVVAHDIARLLLSGLLFNPSAGQATLLGSERIELAAGQRARVTLPLEMAGGFARQLVLVFSEVDHDPLLRGFVVQP